MRITLPLRIMIPVIIFVAGATVLSIYYFNDMRLLDRRLHDGAESELRILAVAAAGELESAFRQGRGAEAGSTLERLGGNRRIAVGVLVDAAGRILFATQTRLVGLTVAHPEATDLGPLLEAGRRRRVAVVHHEEPHAVGGAFPVQMRRDITRFLPETTGWLLLRYDLSDASGRLREDLLRRMVPYVAMLSLLSVGLWIFFRRALLDRIHSLMLATRAIAKGDYSVRPHLGGRDEIAELAGDFRIMATALQRHSEHLGFLSRHDPLTGLLNRQGLQDSLQEVILRAGQGGRTSVLYALDIEGFRVINDTQGHAAGDRLLQQVARTLVAELPEEAIVARPAGDDFAVVLPLETGRSVLEAAQGLQAIVRNARFDWQGQSFQVRFNIGAVPIDEGTSDAERALSLADAAAYAAKENPHERIRVWWPGDATLQDRHGQMRWVSRIQSALDEDRLALYAQRIVPLAPTAAAGLHLELLVRLLDPEGRVVAPDRFLPAAQRYRLIGQIDQWVVRNTFDFFASHHEVLDSLEMCCINLSGMSVSDPVILDLVAQGIEWTTGLRADRLVFEITETEAVTHLESASRFIARLRSLGCRFALDDFGSGVSSFGYLKNLDVDLIKIDGVFVRGVVADPMDRAIVRSINDIAHEMGKTTVAEFVESDEILRLVRRMGIDFAQGHALGRAMPLDRLVERPLSTALPL